MLMCAVLYNKTYCGVNGKGAFFPVASTSLRNHLVPIAEILTLVYDILPHENRPEVKQMLLEKIAPLQSAQFNPMQPKPCKNTKTEAPEIRFGLSNKCNHN